MNIKKDFSGDIRALMIVHLALTMGIFFFALVAVALWFLESLEINPLVDREVAIGICALAFIGWVLASRSVSGKRLAAIQDKLLEDKLASYRATHIVRCAMLEAAAFLSLVLFLLHGYLELLVFPGLIILYMMTLIPTRKRIIQELKLDFNETQALEKPVI